MIYKECWRCLGKGWVETCYKDRDWGTSCSSGPCPICEQRTSLFEKVDLWHWSNIVLKYETVKWDMHDTNAKYFEFVKMKERFVLEYEHGQQKFYAGFRDNGEWFYGEDESPYGAIRLAMAEYAIDRYYEAVLKTFTRGSS